MDLPEPKVPKGGGWHELPSYERDGVPVRVFEFGDSGIRVTSSIAIMEMPDGNGTGPQWLVSVSHRRKRAKEQHIERVLRAFDMVGAEEDNHTPGIARSFFLVCDPTRRVECECKTDERVVTEPDGYKWTTPVEGACRGCEYQKMFGKPCPIHGLGM